MEIFTDVYSLSCWIRRKIIPPSSILERRVKLIPKKKEKYLNDFCTPATMFVDKLLNTDRAIEISDIYKLRDKCDYDLNVNFPSIYLPPPAGVINVKIIITTDP